MRGAGHSDGADGVGAGAGDGVGAGGWVPPQGPPVAEAAALPPTLLVVVDTEEAFDWSRPVARDNTDVAAMAGVARGQALCREFGIVPTYVVDWPVVDRDPGWEPLAGPVAAGEALVGAHLHPWVTPPHAEAVTPFHSYPGNLPPALERAKLAALGERIRQRCGSRPVIYKAGRYGLGPHSGATLAALGYRVDLSGAPGFDLGGDGGPDYRRWHNHPYWLDAPGGVLGLPTTGALTGLLGGWSGAGGMWRLANGPAGRRLHLGGILARLGGLERLRLSPEGHTLAVLQRLTRWLLARGVRVFSFSFHSPSLVPGNTPYVADQRQLAEFLACCRGYFAFFLGELGGVAGTPLTVRTALMGERRDLSNGKREALAMVGRHS